MNFCIRIARYVIFNKIKTSARNVVSSPLPLFYVLNKLAAGRKQPTLNQLRQFLESKSPSSFTMMDIANAKVRSSIGYLLKGDEIRQEVNSRAEKAMKGLIKDHLLPWSIRIDTIPFQLSYKNCKGANQFHINFFLPDEKNSLLNFAENLSTSSGLLFKYLKCLRESDPLLPWSTRRDTILFEFSRKNCQGNKQFSLDIFLPNGKKILFKLIEKFNYDSKLLIKYLKYVQEVKFCDIKIPRCKLSYEFQAKFAIEESGLTLNLFSKLER